MATRFTVSSAVGTARSVAGQVWSSQLLHPARQPKECPFPGHQGLPSEAQELVTGIREAQPSSEGWEGPRWEGLGGKTWRGWVELEMCLLLRPCRSFLEGGGSSILVLFPPWLSLNIPICWCRRAPCAVTVVDRPLALSDPVTQLTPTVTPAHTVTQFTLTVTHSHPRSHAL